MVATAGIEAGRKALLVERDALDRLAESLDASFDRAIDTIVGAEGRVVVSGIGKSGHGRAQDRGDPGLDRHRRRCSSIRPRPAMAISA